MADLFEEILSADIHAIASRIRAIDNEDLRKKMAELMEGYGRDSYPATPQEESPVVKKQIREAAQSYVPPSTIKSETPPAHPTPRSETTPVHPATRSDTHVSHAKADTHVEVKAHK